MTDYRYMFSTSDRHCKLNHLRWQNMSAHLTNETSYWLKKLLMHLNWAIHDVSDLNIDPHVFFFPTVTESGSVNPVCTARGLSTMQREDCMRSLTTQKPKRLPRVGTVFLEAGLVGIRDGHNFWVLIGSIPHIDIVYWISRHDCNNPASSSVRNWLIMFIQYGARVFKPN